MSQMRTRILPLLLIGLLAAAVMLSGCGPKEVRAQASASDIERSVTVLGRATVSGQPDVALIGVGVETLAANVGDAAAQNNAKMAAVLAKLKELGIADKDIQTSNFSINSERNYGGDPTAPAQYRVSNMVQIKIRDLSKVGSTLDAAVSAGANQVWGVSFTIEDQSKLEAEARTKAVADAKSRAESLAKLADVELGPVLAVTEGGAVMPVYYGGGRGASGAGEVMMAAAPTSISPGEVQVMYQVQITYGIE